MEENKPSYSKEIKEIKQSLYGEKEHLIDDNEFNILFSKVTKQTLDFFKEKGANLTEAEYLQMIISGLKSDRSDEQKKVFLYALGSISDTMNLDLRQKYGFPEYPAEKQKEILRNLDKLAGEYQNVAILTHEEKSSKEAKDLINLMMRSKPLYLDKDIRKKIESSNYLDGLLKTFNEIKNPELKEGEVQINLQNINGIQNKKKLTLNDLHAFMLTSPTLDSRSTMLALMNAYETHGQIGAKAIWSLLNENKNKEKSQYRQLNEEGLLNVAKESRKIIANVSYADNPDGGGSASLYKIDELNGKVYLVTAAHVVAKQYQGGKYDSTNKLNGPEVNDRGNYKQTIQVNFLANPILDNQVDARIVKIDSNYDIALLEVNLKDIKLEDGVALIAPKYASRDEIENTKKVVITGNIFLTGFINNDTSASFGDVTKNSSDNIVLNALAAPGNSGGPLINEKGNVVGAEYCVQIPPEICHSITSKEGPSFLEQEGMYLVGKACDEIGKVEMHEKKQLFIKVNAVPGDKIVKFAERAIKEQQDKIIDASKIKEQNKFNTFAKCSNQKQYDSAASKELARRKDNGTKGEVSREL